MQIDEDHKRLEDGIPRFLNLDQHPSALELVANRRITDELAGSIGPILEGERGLLQSHIVMAERRNALTLALVIFGTIASVIVIGLMIYRTVGEAVARNTQLAGTDAALRDSEQRFRRVFEESPLPILLANSESQRIVQANPAFCTMLGFEAADLVGKSIAEITHVDDRELLVVADGRTTDAGYFLETRFVTQSGAVTWARMRMTRLSASDRHAALLLCLVEDITRQTQAEAELRQAQKMEAIGQLTGGIAHDFNNLLGVIIGNAEFLIDVVGEDTDQANLAKEILTSALSGADLTRRLLAFARRQALQPRRIDLNASLPNHITILQRLLGETIRVTTTLGHNLWLTRADPSQIGDALLNLAINARDAMPLRRAR